MSKYYFRGVKKDKKKFFLFSDEIISNLLLPRPNLLSNSSWKKRIKNTWKPAKNIFLCTYRGLYYVLQWFLWFAGVGVADDSLEFLHASQFSAIECDGAGLKSSVTCSYVPTICLRKFWMKKVHENDDWKV